MIMKISEFTSLVCLPPLIHSDVPSFDSSRYDVWVSPMSVSFTLEDFPLYHFSKVMLRGSRNSNRHFHLTYAQEEAIGQGRCPLSKNQFRHH